MNKIITKIVAVGLATFMTVSVGTMTAFAATPNYVNSVGSAQTDIGILDNSSYTVTGNDTTQNKKSEYKTITYADQTVTSKCDVYATIAEGTKVYDPTNPSADDDGFVNGDILVGVPTVLIMSGTPNSNGEYVAEGKGKVKGNIAGTTVINVVPDSAFTMSQSGKTDINATVTQNNTKFVVPTSTLTGTGVSKTVTPTFNDNATFTVKVATDKATAGSWKGSFNYTISLTTQD